MTKIYEGCGEYTIHLSSGKTVTLNEDELGEISETKVSRELYNEQCHAIDEIEEHLEEIFTSFKELKEVFKLNKHVEQDVINEESASIDSNLVNIENYIIIAKRQSTGI